MYVSEWNLLFIASAMNAQFVVLKSGAFRPTPGLQSKK
ncbi:hypothetical protein RISK_006538 [Rhodopirellula islandica]|uniref:Uncharacterized protein n=1 Tax=Rhodopirellula islandica TaxID=595434 RepID=A0A0J1B3Q6_RHOIS|nr:hypothetical protein RISK_006538 [Rhodopirellula islandica]